MPNQQWGRNEATLWPRRAFLRTAGAVLLSVVVCGGLLYLRVAIGLSPLERYYLPLFARTAAAARILQNGSYSLLIIANKTWQGHAVLEADLAPGLTQVAPKKWAPFVPSEAAQNNGFTRLFLEPKRLYNNRRLHEYLCESIYGWQGLRDLFAPPLWGSLGIFMVALCYAVPQDFKRRRELRYGRRLKGPEMLPPEEFSQRLQSDGVHFKTTQKRFAFAGKPIRIGIPRRTEDSHIMLMGDTGAGKSSLIRQLLLQIQQRGESAIVYDPALEYVAEFYSPSRGDIILNPLDLRMPFWNPSAELAHPSEAAAIAESLFPQREHENPFFVEGPRKIFAHLLAFRPTPAEMAHWMCHPEEIDRRVRGTELAAFIDPKAPQQRGGILASLNMVGDAFKSLPTERETKAGWTALEWTKTRSGWIFLPSKPAHRQKLLPLISLWLDMLVLRLMNERDKAVRRVWFVLDELASLQRLPQLHTAVTENRKCHNPLVLGFHGRSQLESRYGRDAEAMLSQPATKIFLRTSEERAAEWVSKMIGEVEIERLRESHHHGLRQGRDFGLERLREPLVMASEISGLADLRGYLKLANYVTRFEFPFLELPTITEPFLPRPMEDGFLTLTSPSPAASRRKPGSKQNQQLEFGGEIGVER